MLEVEWEKHFLPLLWLLQRPLCIYLKIEDVDTLVKGYEVRDKTPPTNQSGRSCACQGLGVRQERENSSTSEDVEKT
jgi:hypothetical protein